MLFAWMKFKGTSHESMFDRKKYTSIKLARQLHVLYLNTTVDSNNKNDARIKRTQMWMTFARIFTKQVPPPLAEDL